MMRDAEPPNPAHQDLTRYVDLLPATRAWSSAASALLVWPEGAS
jgi:hypothetical protein